MSAGGYWTASQDSLGQARMNQKTVTIDTGSHLAALPTTYPDQIIVSLDSTGGFSAGFVYVRDPTNTTWNQVYPPGPHDHSGSTTGGFLATVLEDNLGQFLFYNYLSPFASQFLQTVTGGTISNVQGSGSWNVQLATGTVANNLAQADIGGIALDFGSAMKFIAKITEGGASTSLQGRIGVNIEAAGAAVSNTTKSLGFEFCDSTGLNYQLVSCDGTTRTVASTGQAFAGTNNIRFVYTPTTSVVGTVNQTTATTKTSNLPNSGATANDKISRFGIQTTNTIAKNLNIHGFQLVGMDNDTWFV